MINVTIQRITEDWTKQRKYQRIYDHPPKDGGSQYAYVDAELPETKTITLLEQTIQDEGMFDLPEVIKAINKL